ncbi:2'-5' RNA ligase family protein [Modestobacter italicus]|uniref:2'-5' RNA ligase family protein n=1 Tax=Modestobacter italicus (strain DSM 44449 / CECT 9708 / BC 501) TaxID=2732864 RepID=UPI001C97AA70|nr:2'-5' RNA ligase family protein [Modestobacter italicus]
MTDRPLRADDTFVHRPAASVPGSVETCVLGVVVSVPEPWAQLLVEWRGKCGDPQARLVPPHVTLLPPTEVPVAQRGAISDHLSEVARQHPPFVMHLSGTGTFRPISEVVFVAVAQGIADCELIASDVRSGPLHRTLSFPYHPHVTVAHDVPADMLDMAYAGLAEVHAEFRVDTFTEFEQLPDGAWAVSREYRLTGPPR